LLLIIFARFRWVYCQLDALRRCFPSSIRKTVNELPTTLDETYERTLQEIPKQRRQHAHRLFQCLVAAVRPLRVEELGEIFAIEFDEDAVPNLMEDWRPENAEEAVLSACSTLIWVVDNDGSKIVQFSHFSVKEFLTSDRLLTSDDGNLRYYYFPLNWAHTILARACLTVLLQLDEKVDKRRLAAFPLAFYAARHWVDHAKFNSVASRVKRAMEQLFNPSGPYLTAWTRIYDVNWNRFRQSIDELPKHPSAPGATALYCAALCGFSELADYLISTHGEDVNIGCGRYGTPLHAASSEGHLETARILLDRGADIDITASFLDRTPLCIARNGGHLGVMRLLLDYGANVNARNGGLGLLLHYASVDGEAEVIRLLMQHKADVNAIAPHCNWTPLHFASVFGRAKVAEILLEHGAYIDALAVDNRTPLYQASASGHLEVVRLLLKHGADVHIQREDGRSPLNAAILRGHAEVVQLLSEYGTEGG